MVVWLRSIIALSVLLLWSGQSFAQCAEGEEVCLEQESAATLPVAESVDSTSNQVLEQSVEPAHDEASEELSVTLTDEVTNETFTDEQADLVAGITRDLKRRSLTRPVGNNAFEKILRLQEIHPNHDYSVNGKKYIARILMLLGRQALRRGDLELASRYMLKAPKYDSRVGRQAELKAAISEAARDAAKTRETARVNKEQADSGLSLTTYLPGDSNNDTSAEPIKQQNEDIKFVAPVMVAIPAGNFLMGSDQGAEDEKPVHHVALEAFSMSKHEITMQQFRVFALATGRPAPQYLPQESNLPATNVSWSEAVAYTQWLSNKTRRLFRLPSESEWEYAARAGTTTNYFTGDTLVNAANCIGCGGQWSGKSVAPVGSFDPNEFGLYDTHGNVWEWVEDCWTDNYDGRSKSAAAIVVDGCKRHVLRGGSWYNDADYARASYRGNEMFYFRDSGVGFRVVHEGL